MKQMLMITILFAVLATGASAQKPVSFGSLTYPAPGNIDWDEGTLELWIVNQFETVPKSTNSMNLFDIRLPSSDGAHYYLGYIGWANSLAQIGFSNPRHSYIWSDKLKWKPGERHYIAWSWSGRVRSLFIDGHSSESGPFDPPLQGEGRGRSSASVVVEGELRGNMTGAQLIVGGGSLFAIDEIRISSVARSTNEIARVHAATTPPSRDAFTLLLDHCDGSAPEIISGLSGEKAGSISGAHKFVDGQFGKALQLWSDQPQHSF
jgi:hypothetical protein